MSKEAICCPKCEWEPSKQSRWYCTCGHAWNTFDTAGTCPSCDRQWQKTQCHNCSKFSPHLDWYRYLDWEIQEELLSLAEFIPH